MKLLIADHAGVIVNFRETAQLQEGNNTDRYTGAYFYTIKGDDFILSVNHPDVGRNEEDGEEHNDKRMKIIEYVNLVTQRGIRNKVDMYALAYHNAQAGNNRLKEFICCNETRAVQLISTAWAIEEAPAKKLRMQKTRMEMLNDCLKDNCTCEPKNNWMYLALKTLANNNIALDRYTQAVVTSLTLGRGKFRNMIHVGPQTSGKTFLLKPLKMIYNCFENPSHAKFNFFKAADCEIIVLNELRLTGEVMPWDQALQLLEGDTVNFAAPKNWAPEDVQFTADTPIFATSSFEVMSTKVGEIGQRENEMMRVRWNVFKFTHSITQADVVECEPCKFCYAKFIHCHVPYEWLDEFNFNL